MPTDRPNIVLVMSDQHNRRIAGCYGDRIVQTSNMDRLAAAGVRFDGACCPYPLCAPARMSFLAARHPHAIGVYDNPSPLRADVPTFAHSLGAGGYRAVLCGRMHFRGYDQRHGFAERIFPDCGGPGEALAGTNQFGRRSLEVSGPGRNPYLLYDERCTDRAVAWLGEQARAAPDAPFCLVVGWAGPHCPFVCPRDLFEKYHDRVDLPEFDHDRLHPYHQRSRLRSRLTTATAAEIRRTRAAYYGMVEFDDRLLGRLLDAIDGSPLADNTLVIYTSDHGELAGEHGLWWKLSFYEGSVGVPLIVRWPGRLAAGRVVADPVSLMDLGPTLADLTGSPALPQADGRSLWPLLQGRSAGEPADVFSEFFVHRFGDEGPQGGPARMVRRGDWKCNYYHGEPAELFNLADDPDERTDRASDPACRDRLGQMLAAIRVGWDPDRIAAEARNLHERMRFINKAPRDPSLWEQEWEAPPDYGCVEPV